MSQTTKSIMLVLCLCAFALQLSAQSYTITDIGTLGGALCVPRAINATGQVTGQSSTSGGSYHAFLYTPGNGMTDLGLLPNTNFSTGFGINASGQVVGVSQSASGPVYPFLYSSSTGMTDISTLVSSLAFGGQALGINDSGQITGVTTFPGYSNFVPFLYTPGSGTVNLGTWDNSSSSSGFGNAVNSSGQVAGFAANPVHAFLYTPGSGKVDLGVLSGFDTSEGTAVNDSGQVAGNCQVNHGTFVRHPFLYTPGSGLTDIGTLPGHSYAQASGINGAGQVVGTSFSDGIIPHAFLSTPGTGMIDLNMVLPSGFGWILTNAYAINEAGQIVADGQLSGQTHGFVLSPANTPVGSNISTQPKDVTTGADPVALTFTSITSAGTTSLSVSSSGPPPSQGFKLGSPPTYYNLTSTAAYTGSITICINYSGVSFHNPSQLSIGHFDTATSSWIQLATTVDTTTQTACATTPSLSPFALFEPVYQAYVQQPINPDGSSVFSVKKGVVPVKFTLTFGGVSICSLPPTTISLFRVSGATSTSVDEGLYLMPSDSGTNFRIDTSNCQYVYNLGASSLGTGTYLVKISIGGSVVGSGTFGLQ